jgi:putative ABC transport system ATP-binding protein
VTALIMQDVQKARGRASRSVQVIDGASLSVARGEVVLLKGPSGSGKTTLLALAAGLLMPDKGTVQLDGIALHDLSAEQLRQVRAGRVGFVFQRANLFSRISVLDNVLLSARLAGMDSLTARKEALALLAFLGLEKCTDRYPDELSGGEEQRVALARALVHKPVLVLADEPTGSLDSVSGKMVAEALATMAHARDAAVVIATHDARLEPIASRILALRDGRILSDFNMPDAAGQAAGHLEAE